MATIHTIKEAKDFIAGRIVAEAEHEGIPLSEVERKMMYFTETGWTLPDMKEVNEEFDRNYDQDNYEVKIAGLVQSYLKRKEIQTEEEKMMWHEAAYKLSRGDHYLSVLIDAQIKSDSPEWWAKWLPQELGGYDGHDDTNDAIRLIIFTIVTLVVIGLFYFALQYVNDRYNLHLLRERPY